MSILNRHSASLPSSKAESLPVEGDISSCETYEYTPESDVESSVENDEEIQDESVPLAQLNGASASSTGVSDGLVELETTNVPVAESQNVAQNVPVPAQANVPPVPAQQQQLPPGTSGPVEGFQLVQATGLTDTSTPAPKGSAIPSFATPTPLADFNMPSAGEAGGLRSPAGFSSSLPPVPPPAAAAAESYNPLQEESKSKQFTARTDYMIAEFFSRQVARLTGGATASLDRSYRIFQQRFKERLGAQWAHITSQPEVEEAIKRVQDMYDYFEALEKIVRKQKIALEKVNDIESELSLWYRKEGVSEPAGSIRDDMLHLSTSYHTICTERSVLISAYEQYAQFLHTFQKKAVGDALDTMKKQHASRLELDAYGSKLGQLEEKKLKTFARAPGPSESAALEKELNGVRSKFQDAKNKYTSLSTSLIDKAGLLDLKKGVDFAAHIQKIRQVHDAFNRGRVGSGVEIPPEEDEIVVQVDEHGLPIAAKKD